jgi:hypothetical protein
MLTGVFRCVFVRVCVCVDAAKFSSHSFEFPAQVFKHQFLFVCFLYKYKFTRLYCMNPFPKKNVYIGGRT